MREQCICQQSPMNCAQEPSMTKNSSSSRAPKTGAQLPDNPEERENCGKTAKSPSPPPLLKVEYPSLLRTKMSTSFGDELNLGHSHCRNRLCMITRMSITVDELRHVIDHTGMQQPVQNSTRCNCGSSAVSSTSAVENCRTCTTNVDHLINVLQKESHCGNRTKGICICATTGMTTTVSKHEYDELHCKISTVFTQTATKNLLDLQNRDIEHLINGLQLGHLSGRKNWTERNGLCAMTGWSTTCLCSITAISTALSMN